MNNVLKIGECQNLFSIPFYYPLKDMFEEQNREFISGTIEELDAALEKGQVDVALASPLSIVSAPLDYVVIPDLGYASRGAVHDMLLFSDILLDDMEELTFSLESNSIIAPAMLQIILERYLMYQSDYISGWGNAESFLLTGDAALRERTLSRYTYVYDLGNLWKHYTGNGMIYYMWVIKKSSLKTRENQIRLFHRQLRKSIEVSRTNWKTLAMKVKGYNWIRPGVINKLWSKTEFDLQPLHFDGLKYFYEDCADIGIIDDVPELEYFEND
jgi:chorismate dehydratase